jgi:hypothetical protein
MKRDRFQFGPWTTSLYHGSSAELSTFWRHRLGRLTAIATQRQRLSAAGVALLCLAASLLLLLPRLELQATARAQEPDAPSAVSSVASFAAVQSAEDEPFTATFSNGVKVQLIGLSENPSQGKPWWAPDGTKLENAPYARVPAVMQPDEKHLAREVCWRWINKPDDPDFVADGQVTELQGAGGGIPFDEHGQKVTDLTGWAIAPKSRETCTARFSVTIGATPWRTLFTSDGELSAMSDNSGGVRRGVVFGKPYAENNGTSITVSYEIPGMSVRLVAVDKDGLPDTGTSSGGAGTLGFSQSTHHYANLPPDRIHRFELQWQQRQFETIEFRNVSLHPDRQTNVEIVRDAQLRYEKSVAAHAKLASDHGYQLAPDEPLKHLPPPFPQARHDVASILGSGMGASFAAQPIEFIRFQWLGGQLQAQSFDHVKPSLRLVLDHVFHLKLQDLEGDLDLLDVEVPGDWVLSWDSRLDHNTNVDEIVVLERVLNIALGETVKLELREVERPVYVVQGRYKFTPVPGPDGKVQQVEGDVAAKADGTFQVPGRRTDVSYSAGSYREFLQSIGQLVLTPIIDEADTRPTKESFFWHYYGAVPPALLKPFDEKTTITILESIAKQTGFKFEKSKRRVPTLFIQRESTAGTSQIQNTRRNAID